jgi:hypothetical protein
MYVRFVLAGDYLPGRQRAGILRAPRACFSCRTIDSAERIFAWLNRRLPVPWRDVFSEGRGLCWFKLEAKECVERLRALALLIEKEGGRVWQVYSRDPGRVTYEEEYQVVAVPYSLLARDPS